MYKLEYISASGEELLLTGNENFKLANVDGITVANVDISSSSVASMDGDVVTNTRTMPRSIVLDLAIEKDVERVKRYILHYIKPKQKCTLRMTQDDRTTQIFGIIETIDLPRYTMKATMQVTVYCSDPYWQDVENSSQELSEIIDLFYFTDNTPEEIESEDDNMLFFPVEGIPFGEYDTSRTKNLTNDGDVAAGLEIHIIALATVTNPVIYNGNGEYIGVDLTLSGGDEVIITTGKGTKTIRVNGENKISKIREGSTWLQLEVGENEFTIDSEDGTEGNMYFTLVYKRRFV